MATVTLSSKGQLVVPKAIRERLKLKPGDKIDFQLEPDNKVLLTPIKSNLADLKGFLPKPKDAVSLEEMEATIATSGLNR